MNAITRFASLCAALTTALVLTACGGGSSGGGGIVKPPPPPPTPAIVGVVEPAGKHGANVSRVLSDTAGSDADIERVILDPEGTVEETVAQLIEQYGEEALAALRPAELTALLIQPAIDEFLAGLPLLEVPTPQAYAEQLARYDVTNGSYDINDLALITDTLGPPRWDNPVWLQTFAAQFEYYRTEYPDWWAAATQAGVPAHERTLRVWSAGNERRPIGSGGFGDPALSTHHVKIFSFPEFWGHELIATALDADGTTIADYANYCGPLPAQWNAATHGRHYCIAAPGDGPNYANNPDDVGTSYAAPRVAGVLAQMHVAARETMRGSHLVKRLVDTADNTGEFANAYVYGAGRMNAERALSPQGAMSYASASGGSHSASTTSVTLPTAYGDAAASLAGSEVMAWDEDLFPFWIPTGSILQSGERQRSPIPTFDDDSARTETCALSANLTGGAHCFGSEESPWSTIVAAHGGGTSYALNDWSQINAFTRLDGRLDGAGKGGLALTQHSTILGATLHRDWELFSGKTRVKAGTKMSLLVDAPWQTSAGADTMLDIGTTVLSSAEANVTIGHGEGATTLKVEQPPRAETGTGRLSFPYTRTLDGEPRFEHREFSLSPSEREITASLRHERDDIAGGRLALMVSHTMNPGHSNEGPDNAIGIAWRRSW